MLDLTIGPHTFFFKSYCSAYDLVSVLILNEKFPEWLIFIFVQFRQRTASNSTLLFFFLLFSSFPSTHPQYSKCHFSTMSCFPALVPGFVHFSLSFVFSFSPSVYDRTPGFTHARPAFCHEGTNAALSFRFA